MLIVPVFSKAVKRTPYICITLVLINIFIYFFLQAGDSHIQQEAYRYYESSGLLNIELKTYLNYLQKEQESILLENALTDERNRATLTSRMFSDNKFNKLLLNNQIITNGHPGFLEWRNKRDEFEKIEQQTVIARFGYSPLKKNTIGLFTCIFLHGSIMHLVGNMVFLWLVGAILEKAVGSIRFIILYGISGICASALFAFAYPLSPGPLIGASGAIAGLMGAYGIIFGMRKIRIFYSLGFYFNYANIPALALFPLWLSNEVFQLYTNSGSHVAYMAHIGGLLSGMLFGTGYRLTDRHKIESLFVQEEEKNQIDQLLDNGMQKLLALDFQAARKDFDRVLTIAPNNPTALRQLFTIDKSAPFTDEFHHSAHRLLNSMSHEKHQEYLSIFEEYNSTAGKPRVSTTMLERLSHCYMACDNFTKASSCIAAILKRSPENAKIPGFLLKLAKGLWRTGKKEEAKKCCRILVGKFGMSRESLEAKDYLKRQ